MILPIIHHMFPVSADSPDNTVSIQNKSSCNVCIEAGGNPSWRSSKWRVNTSTYPGSHEKAAGSARMMALHNINSSCFHTNNSTCRWFFYLQINKLFLPLTATPVFPTVPHRSLQWFLKELLSFYFISHVLMVEKSTHPLGRNFP